MEGLEDGAGEEAAGALAGLSLVEDGLGGLAPEDDGERLPGRDLPVHLLLPPPLRLLVIRLRLLPAPRPLLRAGRSPRARRLAGRGGGGRRRERPVTARGGDRDGGGRGHRPRGHWRAWNWRDRGSLAAAELPSGRDFVFAVRADPAERTG